jgi:hypothetical protein
MRVGYCRDPMRRVAAVLLICGLASAQAATLPPERDASANWQKAGLLSQGGIPNRTAICATVSPLGADQDDTSGIQRAVDGCPVDQVVQLAPGSFTIAEGRYVLLNRGITLRGAGAGSTILQRKDGAKLGSNHPGASPSPMIIAGQQRWSNYSSGSTPLTVDGVQGATSVQVQNAAGFAIGQIVMVDEASGASWQPDRIWPGRQIWASPDYRVVWTKHNPPTAGDDFDANTYPYTSGSAACWFSDCDRPTNEMHQITAISGNTITFDTPLTVPYRVSHQAMLYYWKTSQFTWNAGIENLTAEYGDDGNIEFYGCAYCWAKDVESTLWLGAGFDIAASFRVQLEGVYIHDGVWPVPGGGGYNISLSWWSSEILIENSISLLTNKVMVDRSAGAGSVVAYNYMDDGYVNGQGSWVEIGLNASHMVGAHHVLFEGNYGFNIDSDQTHGNSTYLTFFRNYVSGFRRPFTALDGTHIDDTTRCCGPLRAAAAHAYAYWFSFIGNVLGTPGQMNGWVYDAIGGLNAFPPNGIWMLGYHDVAPQGYDPHVAETTIRNGNFDYLTNQVHWAAEDTTHALPNSLYLSQKPPFFNAGRGYAWPWVNPMGSQQLYALPAKARYEAGTPFTQP